MLLATSVQSVQRDWVERRDCVMENPYPRNTEDDLEGPYCGVQVLMRVESDLTRPAC